MRRTPVARFAATFFAIVACCTLLVASTRAFAFTPPPNDGPVTDPAGKLTPADKQALDDKLRNYKAASGNEVTFFIAASLDGEDIADVAYDTANAWKLGTKEKEKDVLVVLAPNERKVRIETAKGAGGDLTDLQTHQILQTAVEPHLRENDFRGAVADGSDAIIAALGDNAAGKVRGPTAGNAPSVGSVVGIVVVMLLIIFFLARRGGGGGGGRRERGGRSGGGGHAAPRG